MSCRSATAWGPEEKEQGRSTEPRGAPGAARRWASRIKRSDDALAFSPGRRSAPAGWGGEEEAGEVALAIKGGDEEVAWSSSRWLECLGGGPCAWSFSRLLERLGRRLPTRRWPERGTWRAPGGGPSEVQQEVARWILGEGSEAREVLGEGSEAQEGAWARDRRPGPATDEGRWGGRDREEEDGVI